MYIVSSTFRVSPESAEDIDTLYRLREHLVDGADGFLGLDVLRNDADRSEFTLLVRWSRKTAYEAYRKSEAFVAAHRRMLDLSRKVRILPGSHSIKCFEHVAS